MCLDSGDVSIKITVVCLRLGVYIIDTPCCEIVAQYQGQTIISKSSISIILDKLSKAIAEVNLGKVKPFIYG